MATHLQLHLLTPHPISNSNRDDIGQPKSATINDRARPRLSSQAIKQAVRSSEHFAREGLGTRTKQFGRIVIDELVRHQPDISAQQAEAVALKVMSILDERRDKSKDAKRPKAKKVETEPKAEPETETRSDELLQSEQMMFLSYYEIERLKAIARAILAGSETPYTINDVLTPQQMSLDVAMFGRMVAKAAQHNVEAAVQISHAMTTHNASIEEDFFTAIDDIGETKRAAHVGHRGMIGGGVFYIYADVNCDLLVNNLGGTEEAKTVARAGVSALVRALMMDGPRGMRASFASGVVAEYAKIERGSSQPFTEQVAFHRPVTGDDLLAASIERFRTSRAQKLKAYQMNLESAEFTIPEGNINEFAAFAAAW